MPSLKRVFVINASSGDDFIRFILEHVPGMVGYLDSRLTFRFVNKEYEKYSGKPREQIIGKTFREIFGISMAAALLKKMQDALAGNEVEFEQQLLFPSGELHDIYVKYVPDFGPTLSVKGFVILVHDVTKLRRQQKELDIQKERLAQSAKLLALGQMVVGISHEINNPLTIIRFEAEKILDTRISKTASLASLCARGQKIINTVDRICKIMHSVRGVTANVKTEPFVLLKLASVLNDVVELSKRKFESIGVDFSLNCPESLQIYCSPIEISQTILNLLNNACDAVQDLKTKIVSVICDESGECVRIRVSDSGPGVNKEIHHALFEPFVTTKDRHGGMGLGLNMSRAFISGHDGTIEYSRHGERTVFEINLPIRR